MEASVKCFNCHDTILGVQIRVRRKSLKLKKHIRKFCYGCAEKMWVDRKIELVYDEMESSYKV